MGRSSLPQEIWPAIPPPLLPGRAIPPASRAQAGTNNSKCNDRSRPVHSLDKISFEGIIHPPVLPSGENRFHERQGTTV